MNTRLGVTMLVLTAPCWAQTWSKASARPSEAKDYKLVFSDEFDKVDLSPDGLGSYTWYEDLWYSHHPAPRSNVWASRSQLSLVWRAGQVSPDTSIETLAHDRNHATAWRYGYFEVRAKWDVVRGAWPALWLIAVQDAKGQAVTQGVKESGELDIFEGQGAEPHTYYGTIHDWVGKRDIPGTKNNFPLADSVDLSQFHTYGVLWIPGKVTWYLDNAALHSEPTPAVFDRQDYFLVLGMQEGVGWKYGNTAGLGADKLTMVVDWVRVWQK